MNFPFVRGADGTQVLQSKEANVPIKYLYCAVKGVKIRKGYAKHFSFLKEQLIIAPSEKETKEFESRASGRANRPTYRAYHHIFSLLFSLIYRLPYSLVFISLITTLE